MTQEELNKIPKADMFSYVEVDGLLKPMIEKLGAYYPESDNDPIYVIDENGDKWTFAIRISDSTKVRVKANVI